MCRFKAKVEGIPISFLNSLNPFYSILTEFYEITMSCFDENIFMVLVQNSPL